MERRPGSSSLEFLQTLSEEALSELVLIPLLDQMGFGDIRYTHGILEYGNVLPALVPGMAYEGMQISKGTDAGLALERMICDDISDSERATLRGELQAYCRQDTLAMVRLLESLQR